jgi:hypothetical protein
MTLTDGMKSPLADGMRVCLLSFHLGVSLLLL